MTDTIDWHEVQRRLGVGVDGIPGKGTYTALFAFGASDKTHCASLGLGAAVHIPAHGIDTPLRLSHFMAQVAHESGGFKFMREIWGPTPAQRGYEGRKDLGNTVTGDGYRYRGRGPLQLTGRANYRTVGTRIGIDLEASPELAELPSVGILIACEYWRSRNINAAADRNDGEKVTRLINGGLNGFKDRMERLVKYQEVVGA